VKLIAIALIAVAPLVLVGLWAATRLTDQQGHDPGVEANARLIGYASVLLVLPLAAEIITGIRPGLLAHALIGFLLLPLVLLKLGSVGYRFVRYYAGDPRYRAAGPPFLLLRLLGPLLVLLTVVVFATGIELWLFGFGFGTLWLTLHKASFVLWFLAITVHGVAYARRASLLAFADTRTRLGGALARRSLVVASLVAGVVLVVAMLPFASPISLVLGGG
jgi:hypothetical protein